MIVFTLFGMLVLASIIGLFKYKYDQSREDDIVKSIIDWKTARSDYYAKYEAPNEPDYDAEAAIAEIEDSWDKQAQS
jgi:hypothetical protein